MAKLALIYGMRLLPEEDLGEVKDATVVLKNGRTARVTMHLIEGSKEEIENTFRQSIEAFFEMYPEILSSFRLFDFQFLVVSCNSQPQRSEELRERLRAYSLAGVIRAAKDLICITPCRKYSVEILVVRLRRSSG